MGDFVDFGLAGDIVDVTAATDEQCVFAVVEVFHPSDASRLVEVGELAKFVFVIFGCGEGLDSGHIQCFNLGGFYFQCKGTTFQSYLQILSVKLC